MPSQEEKVKEITEKLEQGIQELFDSERYKEYLDVMSKFHNYSLNNTLLIAMQKPDATFVAGYTAWKNNFERNVMKGEHGIRILAPSPYKIKKEVDKIDPNTQKPVIGTDGNPVREEMEITVPAFKVVSVFDVSQTEGKELPTIGVDELTGDVEQYADFFKAVEQVSPAPVGFEKIVRDGTKGYYSQTDKRIAINEGMSELQNLKTLIHEIAHAKLHDIDLNASAEKQADRPDRRTREVQAESIAYAVCQHYGIDTSDYSFAYIAQWSSGRELAELKASLKIIRDTAAELIEDIDTNFAALTQNREQVQAEDIREEDTFTIYQLKDNASADYPDWHFLPLAELQEKGLTVDPANYKKVYTAPLAPGMGLEQIFEKFNLDRPEDFKGHSLSTSDVVVIHQSGQDTAHYTDSIGFVDVSKDFLLENFAELQSDREMMQKSTLLLVQNRDISKYGLMNIEGMNAAETVKALSVMDRGKENNDRLSISAYLENMGAQVMEIANENTIEFGEYHIDVRYNIDTQEIIDHTAEKITTEAQTGIDNSEHEEKSTSLDTGSEPTVTIIWSEHNHFHDGETMSLSEANAIMENLDKATVDDGRYYKTKFCIDFVMDGQHGSYTGRQDLGDGEGTLIEHIEKYYAYYENNEEWDNYLLHNKGPEALEADKAQREMVLHDFVPYLQLHNNLSQMERISTEALQESARMTPEETAYHTAMKEYVPLCRAMVNNGDYNLPPVPQLEDVDTSFAAYKEHVEEEIAQEAADAGMTVEEYAANGYEPYYMPEPEVTQTVKPHEYTEHTRKSVLENLKAKQQLCSKNNGAASEPNIKYNSKNEVER